MLAKDLPQIAEAGFEPEVRAAISSFAKLPHSALAPGLRRLEADLQSGHWHERNAALLERDSVDWGYRLVIAD